jgi:RNA polymerase sigma factor (sigma-70 family)
MNSNKIIQEYLPLVKSFAVKYRDLGLPYDDLVQEGLIGLSEAVDNYDESQGTKFSTYASYWIKKKILAAIDTEKKQTSIAKELTNLKIKEHKQESNKKDSISIPQDFPENEKIVLHLLYTAELTLSEIAEKLNISRERVRQLKEKALRRLKTKILKN